MTYGQNSGNIKSLFLLDLLYLLRSEELTAELDQEYEWAQEIVDSSFDIAEQYISCFHGSTMNEMEDFVRMIFCYYLGTTVINWEKYFE